MKRTPIIFFFVISILSVAQGQDAQEAFPLPSTGGLQITDTRTDKERIEFLTQVANAYIEEKDYKSAVTVFERILTIDPDDLPARHFLASVCIDAQEYQKAEDMFLSLYEEDPNDYRTLNNLAWLYATAKDPEFRDGKKAIKYAQMAMVLNPNDHHIWSTLAEAYYVSGQYEKAVRAATQMANLAARYGQLTQENIDTYNEQLRKCQRALKAEKILKGESDESENSTTNAPAKGTAHAKKNS